MPTTWSQECTRKLTEAKENLAAIIDRETQLPSLRAAVETALAAWRAWPFEVEEDMGQFEAAMSALRTIHEQQKSP